LTFLGKPRTKVAEHAHETPWTMTLPLVILAIFAVGYGWVGIPEDFMGLHIWPENMFHGIVYSLTEHQRPAHIHFNWIPLIISLSVALGGLLLGWLVYRKVEVGQEDPLKKPLGPLYPVLQNKYYFDELYDLIFVKPAAWISETLSYQWLDRGLIDGILHGIARVTYRTGSLFRDYIDVPIINGFGDLVGESVKKFGHKVRGIQTGRIQQYMVFALITAFGTLFYYLYNLLLP
ncbi:MAG: hypothetical protein ABFS03_07665, partial [Chloroflexota bacterium]